MSIIEKVKLLFKARKPTGELIEEIKTLKSGWKKVSFWLSVLSTLLSVAGALSGVIPPNVSVIINTVLTAFYNVLRGLDKSGEPGIRPPLQSTEFWQGILGEVSNAVVGLKAGGVDPQLLHTCEAIIAGLMAVAQNLGAHQPEPEPGNK